MQNRHQPNHIDLYHGPMRGQIDLLERADFQNAGIIVKQPQPATRTTGKVCQALPDRCLVHHVHNVGTAPLIPKFTLKRCQGRLIPVSSTDKPSLGGKKTGGLPANTGGSASDKNAVVHEATLSLLSIECG